MPRILFAVPIVLMSSFGCHRAPSVEGAPQGATPPNLTSAVLQVPSDEEIVKNVDDAILKSHVAEPQSGDVQVSASAGVVTLSGRVGTDKAKLRIEELARSISGVTSVDDELEAPERNPSTENDEAISQNIEEHLTARNDDGVKVTTLGGRVTLEGTVPTEVEKAEIEKLVKQIPNVTSVDDRIRERPLHPF